MEYEKIYPDLQKNIQLGAGVFLKTFAFGQTIDRANILMATKDGANFQISPTFVDLGQDIDFAHEGMKELIVLDHWTYSVSGTGVTVNEDSIPYLSGAFNKSAKTDNYDARLTPKTALSDADFHDLWWIGDYSDVNELTGSKAPGFLAIHFSNLLATGGFNLKTSNKQKGVVDFSLTACKSIGGAEPVEIYVKKGFVRSGGSQLDAFVLNIDALE